METYTPKEVKETERLNEKIAELKKFMEWIAADITNIIELEAQQIQLNIKNKQKLRYIKGETETEMEGLIKERDEILASKID